MTDLPQPLTPAQRALRRFFADAWRKAARQRRENEYVLNAMNRQLMRRRK